MAADLSAFAYLAPIMAFLLVAVVVFAVLKKTKMLESNPWVMLFISLFVAVLFVSASGARQYVLTVAPWFGVLVVSLFFILFLVAFVGEKASFLHKGIGVWVVVATVLIFLISGVVVFSDFILPYLPGPAYGYGGDVRTLYFTDWLYSPRVWGAVLLTIISAAVAWVLVKSK